MLFHAYLLKSFDLTLAYTVIGVLGEVCVHFQINSSIIFDSLLNQLSAVKVL